jgi:biotin carboxyl carrier protein
VERAICTRKEGDGAKQIKVEVSPMDRVRLFAVALATFSFSALPLVAQEGGTAVQPASPPAVQVPTTATPAASTPAAAAPTTGNSPAVEMKPVKAELVGKLDSKSAKPGDSVVVKTKESVQTANGTEIPKGSKLIGHVALVKAHSKEQENSELAVEFDHAQLKGGQDLPIHSMIESVSPPESEMASNSPDAMSGAPMGGAPSGGAPSGGGAMAGGSRSGGGAATSAPSTGAPATAATDTGGQSQGSGNTVMPGQVVAGSGPNAIRTTSIPNVYLAANANGQVSGTLFSAKSNVRLDGGTQIVLDVAASNSH